MSTLGIDIGTSGCKAVVFDANGVQLSEAYEEYATHIPHEDWAELDSSEVMSKCLSVIREAAGRVISKDPVQGIGVSSQGEAFTAVGSRTDLLTNAMVSFDTRADALARTWPVEFGVEKLYAITGHTAHPMFTLFKILWVRDNLPEVWEQAEHFYCFEELLHLHLGIEPAISYPLAGRTMMFNVVSHVWDADILDAIGLSPDRLARPLPAGETVGKIPDAMCNDLNLAPGTIVVAGGHDQPCSSLGAGVLSSGRAMYGMGTVECICPAFEEAVFSTELRQSNLCTYDFTANDMYTTVAFSLTGGNLLRWFRDEWSRAEVEEARRTKSDVYELILSRMSDSPTDLLVLPHFTPTGTPYFDTEAEGAILGLKLNTTRGDILRALLEGVTMEMKLNMDILSKSGIEIQDFIATGGGAKNRKLTQLKADVLNAPITTVEVTEAGCLGVAMLAHRALTGEALEDVSSRWVRQVDVLEPDPEMAEQYEEKFEKYRMLYPTLKALR